MFFLKTLVPYLILLGYPLTAFADAEATGDSDSKTQIALGKTPARVILKEKLGGRVDGTPWDSSELTGKVHVLFYVDPDEKKVNAHVEDALKKESFPSEKYTSVAVVNMRATWLPSFVLKGILKNKQKKFVRTVFVKDERKVLVQAWGLPDNSYSILVFNKSGELIYNKSTKHSNADISSLVALIRSNL